MKNKHRLLAVLIVVCLLLLGLLSYHFLADPAKFWFCSPIVPRGKNEEAWRKTITALQSIQEPNEAIFDNFTVGSDSSHFTVKGPSESPADNQFAFELDEMTSGGPLEIGGGTLTFSCIATAYHDANQTLTDDAVYRFYNPQLQPISNTKLIESGICSTTETGSNFKYNPWPAVQLAFQYQGIEQLMFHGIKIFDSRTRKSLTSGYSSSGRENSLAFTTHIPLWHRTPVDLIVDISYGPTKTFDFAPRAGEGFSEDNLKCRLISIFEGVDTSTSSRSTRDNMTIHEFRKAPPGKTGLSFFFACLPTASQIPVIFEFLDKNGNKLRTGGSSTSGYAHSIKMKQPLEKIALIRAHYRTRRQRIVIHLPYLPGLPEQNNAIENLFDVYIPYVKFQDAGRVDQFLRHTLQLDSSRSTGPTPANSVNSFAFPMELKDVTIRQIAKRYAQGATLYVDIENSQLRREYPIPLWQQIRQFLQKFYP